MLQLIISYIYIVKLIACVTRHASIDDLLQTDYMTFLWIKSNRSSSYPFFMRLIRKQMNSTSKTMLKSTSESN